MRNNQTETVGSRDTAPADLRELSVEGCEEIGRGAKGVIYRYSDELVVKVYNELNTYEDVVRESELARKAFIMGLPTAISFGIVKVGSRYGAIFELLRADSVSKYIARDPGQAEYYGSLMAELALELHALTVRDDQDFPSAADHMLKWVERGIRDEDDKLADRLRSMVLNMPPARHLIHGDFHTGNVMLQDGVPFIIDVDRLSMGHPIVDLGNMYLFYVAYPDMDPRITESFMGFSADTAKTFYDSFVKRYIGSGGETARRDLIEKSSLIAYTRLVGQIKKKAVLTKEEKQVKDRLMEKIRDLAENIRVKHFA